MNYRPVSVLNIESKIFEKCIYIALYNNFTFYFTKHQHGFVKHRFVFSSNSFFLKKIYEAQDSDPNSEIVAFYTDLSKPLIKCLIMNSSKTSPKSEWAGVYLKSWSTTSQIASSL